MSDIWERIIDLSPVFTTSATHPGHPPPPLAPTVSLIPFMDSREHVQIVTPWSWAVMVTISSPCTIITHRLRQAGSKSSSVRSTPSDRRQRAGDRPVSCPTRRSRSRRTEGCAAPAWRRSDAAAATATTAATAPCNRTVRSRLRALVLAIASASTSPSPAGSGSGRNPEAHSFRGGARDLAPVAAGERPLSGPRRRHEDPVGIDQRGSHARVP